MMMLLFLNNCEKYVTEILKIKLSNLYSKVQVKRESNLVTFDEETFANVKTFRRNVFYSSLLTFSETT